MKKPTFEKRLPIPNGREVADSELGQMRAIVASMEVGQHFPTEQEHRKLYDAARKMGVKLCRQKQKNGGWIYWRKA